MEFALADDADAEAPDELLADEELADELLADALPDEMSDTPVPLSSPLSESALAPDALTASPEADSDAEDAADPLSEDAHPANAVMPSTAANAATAKVFPMVPRFLIVAPLVA